MGPGVIPGLIMLGRTGSPLALGAGITDHAEEARKLLAGNGRKKDVAAVHALLAIVERLDEIAFLIRSDT